MTRIVIKFGSSTLTAGTARLSLPHFVEIARQVSSLSQNGHEIILVSSGAMAAGKERLNYPQLPRDIPAKQMLAAVGQLRLMAVYEQVFGLYGMTVAQILLTRADLGDRRRYLNSRNTLMALLAQNVIPIINENDTVATEEIRVGDNDNLSALVANLIDADTLILLTDQPGLFTADPRHNTSAQLITDITEPDIPESIWQAAGGTKTGLGTGGMLTKLQAADLARRSGTMVVIAPGEESNVLTRLAAGEAIGTRFHPSVTAIESRKRYILTGGNARGAVSIDAGAAHALRRGGSLLAVGMTAIEKDFDRGDTIRILAVDGSELARGITNYTSADLRRILGRKSDEIESILGYYYGDEVVHHNNLVLL
jgi:glutamate 5-kinase